MPDQIPRSLEVITVIDFTDRDSHYLQSWKGQLSFNEGEIVNLLGNLGITKCRPGKYQVYPDDPASQLNLVSGERDIFHKFYTAVRLRLEE